MTSENKTIFLKRLKSFLWRGGCVVAVAVLSWFLEHINLLELPNWLVIGIGLIAGEITKWLNNHTDLFGARLK